MTTKLEIRICGNCGKEFEFRYFPSFDRYAPHGRGKYCSKKCSGFANRNRLETSCLICVKKFYVVPNRQKNGGGKYCSRKCKDKSNSINKAGKKRVEFRISWGYKYLFIPSHPDSSKQGYIAQHRIAMEEKIGRRLTSDEVIHHINFNKSDNRIDNLMLLTRQEHSRLHAELKNRNK